MGELLFVPQRPFVEVCRMNKKNSPLVSLVKPFALFEAIHASRLTEGAALLSPAAGGMEHDGTYRLVLLGMDATVTLCSLSSELVYTNLIKSQYSTHDTHVQFVCSICLHNITIICLIH